MKLTYSLITLLILSFSLQGCIKTYNHRGYAFDEDTMKTVKKGNDRWRIEKVLGTPSIRSYFQPNTVYYIGGDRSSSAFFKPKVTDQKVLVLNYNTEGKLESFQELFMADLHNVAFDHDSTRTFGDDNSFIQQFLGNIGRFKMDTGQPTGSNTGGGVSGR